MAVPFRRTSKTKKNMRRSHMAIEAVGMVKCTNCGAMIRAHRVCEDCGFYKGSSVVKKEEAKA